MTFPKLLAAALALFVLALPVSVYAEDIEESAPEEPTSILTDVPPDEMVEETDGETEESEAVPEDEASEQEEPEQEATPGEPVIVENIDPAIKQLQDYYARVYGAPLKQKSRLAKLVAVMSLSKIDAPQLTEQLLSATNESDKVIAQLAWEALLARSESLTPEQRLKWTQIGFKSADSGAFPGTTVAPVLEAAAQYPLNNRDLMTAEKLLRRLCEESDPNTPEGKAALEAGGRAMAAWSDPRLIRAIYPSTLARSKLFDRAVVMFQQLPNTPRDGGTREWREWNSKAKFVATPASQLKTFNGSSLFFPKPEKIVDANDPKWTKDAELPELKVSALRTVFCLDATGSGAQLNEFVTGFISTLASCIDVVAESNQMGVVYYRHEIDPKYMVACCQNPGNAPDDFRIHVLPVTKKIPELIFAMQGTVLSRQKGHDSGGAAYIGALQSAQRMLGESRRDTISVVALFGDAKATEGKEEFIPQITRKLIDSGINVFILPRDNRAEKALADTIEVSGNDPIFYRGDIQFLQDDPSKSAIDIFEESSFGTLAKRILSCALPPGYTDRADKIVISTTKILRARDRAESARAMLDAQPDQEQAAN